MKNSIIVIPAKGGSKNMDQLDKRPLLEYVLTTARSLHDKLDLIVSTDDVEIANYAKNQGAEAHITSHEGPLQETVAQYGKGYKNIILMQPTSPFIRVRDVKRVLNDLDKFPMVNSSQTVTQVRHNSHPWCQRVVDNYFTEWLHEPSYDAQIRRKQNQPDRWKFGNVVGVRSSLLFERGFFPYPSTAIPIHHFYAFDVDDVDDFKLAEAMIKGGLVS